MNEKNADEVAWLHQLLPVETTSRTLGGVKVLFHASFTLTKYTKKTPHGDNSDRLDIETSNSLHKREPSITGDLVQRDDTEALVHKASTQGIQSSSKFDT